MRLRSVYKILYQDQEKGIHIDDSVTKESEAPNLSLNHGNGSHRASVYRGKMIFLDPTEKVLSFIPTNLDKSELSLM